MLNYPSKEFPLQKVNAISPELNSADFSEPYKIFYALIDISKTKDNEKGKLQSDARSNSIKNATRIRVWALSLASNCNFPIAVHFNYASGFPIPSFEFVCQEFIHPAKRMGDALCIIKERSETPFIKEGKKIKYRNPPPHRT